MSRPPQIDPTRELFVGQTPRRARSSKPLDGLWARREFAWNATRGARQKMILAQLRAAFAEGEFALIGWPQILGWLSDHGFRNRNGRPLNARVVRGWQRRLGLPLLRGCRAFPGRTGGSLPFTSNYLLLAWATAMYQSGGLDKPRIVLPDARHPAAPKSTYSSPPA